MIEEIYNIIQEKDLSFSRKHHIEINKKCIIRESIKYIIKDLENKRITDNNDFISIPIEEWEKIKEKGGLG